MIVYILLERRYDDFGENDDPSRGGFYYDCLTVEEFKFFCQRHDLTLRMSMSNEYCLFDKAGFEKYQIIIKDIGE